MRIDVITLFPEFIDVCARVGVVGRARERGLIEIAMWNPRDFATDNYRSADDRCYGGGPGVVMMIDPLRKRSTARARPADRHRARRFTSVRRERGWTRPRWRHLRGAIT